MITLLVSLVAVVNCQTAQQERCVTDFLTDVDNLNVAAAIVAACADLVRNNEYANNVLKNSPCSQKVLSCDRCALICREHASHPCNQFTGHVISTWLKVSPMHGFPKCNAAQSCRSN